MAINVEIQDLTFKSVPALSDKLEIQEDGGGPGSSKYVTVQGLANIIAGVGGVQSVVAGLNVTVDNADPANPVVAVPSTNLGVLSVSAGTGISITGTPQNPTVNASGVVFTATSGDSINVDNIDPENPAFDLSDTIKAGSGNVVTIYQAGTSSLGIGNSSTGAVSIGAGKSVGSIDIGGGATTPITIRDSQWPSGLGNDGEVLTTNGAGVLSWAPASGGGGGVTSVVGGQNIDVDDSDPANPVVKVQDSPNFSTTGGFPTLSFANGTTGIRFAIVSGTTTALSGTVDGTGAGSRLMEFVFNQGVVLKYSGNDRLETTTAGILITGTTSLNGVEYTWPGSDGTSGQVLSTNGSGTLSWADAGGGGGGSFVPFARTQLSLEFGNFTVANNTNVELIWDTEKLDTAGDQVAMPSSQITVPSGATHARVTCQVTWDNNATGQRFMDLRPEIGQQALGIQVSATPLASDPLSMNASSGWINVTAQNYLEIRVRQESGGNLNIEGNNNAIDTWIDVEWYGP